MPLAVECFAAYLTITPGSGEWLGDDKWRDEDFSAKKFVDAVKSRHVNRYAMIPFGGRRHRLEQSNRPLAFDLFGRWAADRLRAHSAVACALVPVPSSISTIDAAVRGAALVLAEAVKKHAGAKVLDCLRWDQEMPPAREGGPRHPALLYPHLARIADLKDRSCVLIDDVMTTGGHLQASAARLREGGATAVLALCAGRTWHAYPPAPDPFKIEAEELEDYVP
jgi:hypothetical protein